MGLFGPSRLKAKEIPMSELAKRAAQPYMKLYTGENGVLIYTFGDYEITFRKGIHLRNANYKVDFDEKLASKIKAILVYRDGRKTLACYSTIDGSIGSNNVVISTRGEDGKSVRGKDGKPGRVINNEGNFDSVEPAEVKDGVEYNGLPVISLTEVKERGGQKNITVGNFALYSTGGGLNIGNMSQRNSKFYVTVNGFNLEGDYNDGIVGVFVSGRKVYYVSNRIVKSKDKKANQENSSGFKTITMDEVMKIGYAMSNQINGYYVISSGYGMSMSSASSNMEGTTFVINKKKVIIPRGSNVQGIFYHEGEIYLIV